VILRDIKEISEMRLVEELQKEVWGIEDLEVFPALALIPMKEVGAVLIGAFDADRLAGFVFGFPGHDEGRLILHSDMLAVRPEYRGHGLGYKLKLAQRERALADGIDTITWTFDPLQSLNAHLNFNKLGVTGDRYLVNYYGETTSFLHRTGTDRLWVKWLLDSRRVENRIAGGLPSRTPGLSEKPSILRVSPDRSPSLRVPETWNAQSIAIEIPDDINRLLKEDVELAIRWRDATRQAFTSALAAGYVVEDFCHVAGSDENVGVYLLDRSVPK
jgi:predicted GNAT superfamily acetyltransferase